MSRTPTVHDIENLRMELAEASELCLKANGWTATTLTPGCTCLWTREWKGNKLMTDRYTAIDFQSDMESEESGAAREDSPSDKRDDWQD